MPRSVLVITALSLLSACAADDAAPSDTEAPATTADDTSTASDSDATSLDDPSTSSSADSSGNTSTTGDDESDSGSSTGVDTPEMEVVTVFDPELGELPEGLVLAGGDAYVGFAFTGAIERIALADGARTPFANTPPPPPDTAFVTGLELDARGRLYAAFVSFTPEAQAGIYRAPAQGGDAAVWATHPQLVMPNGFAWADDGSLFVTDSAYGGVFHVATDGAAEPWLSDPLLTGDPTVCGGQRGDLAVGANGIVWTPEAVFVAGSDHAVLMRIAVSDDGSAGEATTVAGPDCDTLAGIDGIAQDRDGTIVAAINRADRIVRIDAAGTISTVVEGPPLAFPASLAFGDDGDLYVTSFAVDEYLAGGEPAPALVRVHPQP